MVVTCCAYGCKYRFVKGGPYTFHCFPKDPVVRAIWEKSTKRKNFKATRHTKLCSKHFRENCFDILKFGGTWLKPDAIPTEFDFPKDFLSRQKPPKPPTIVKFDPITLKCESTSHCVAPSSSRLDASPSLSRSNVASSLPNENGIRTKKKRQFYIGDYTREDMSDPSLAKQFFDMAQKRVALQRSKLKCLERKNHRHKMKIEVLEKSVEEIKKKSAAYAETSVSITSVPPAIQELLKRSETGPNKEQYSEELKTFATTLHFYSARAYNYVRKALRLCLPHPSTLQKWKSSIKPLSDSSEKVDAPPLLTNNYEIVSLQTTNLLDLSQLYFTTLETTTQMDNT